MPNRELAYVAPAVAREYRRNPSPIGDVCIAKMVDALEVRAMVDVAELVRAILQPETEAAPTRDAAQPSDAREG